MTRLSLRKHFNEIMITGDTYDVRYQISKVPGSRFRKKNSTWYIPYSPISLRRLKDELDENGINAVLWEVDPANPVVMPLVDKYSRMIAAAYWKNPVNTSAYTFKTKTKPWPHQARAYEFLADLDFNAYLGMKMGTGKTLVAINAIAEKKPRKVLILCPKSVISVWDSEFTTHLHSNFPISVCKLDKGSSRKKADFLGVSALRADISQEVFVCVVNYESFWRPELLHEINSHKWDMLICDEAHRLKNHMGTASKAAFKLSKNINHCILLSGTPIPHKPHDVLGQYRLIDPGIYGTTITRFRSEYYEMGGFKNKEVMGFKNEDQFTTLMGYVTFVVDKDVLGLPPFTHQSRMVDIGRRSWKHYLDMEEEFTTHVKSGEVTASNAVGKLIRLQQITSGFLPVRHTTNDGEYFEQINTAKQDELAEVLEDLRGEKVVIFARFHQDLNNIRTVCEGLGLNYRELSGRTAKLKDGKFPPSKDVLISQIQSGKEGLNLTDSCYTIYWNVWYALSDYDQSLSRTHRGGQDRRVTYIHLIAKDTIDEVIYQALQDNQDIIDAIIECVKTGGVRR